MSLIVRQLGVCSYPEIWQDMRDFTQQRTAETPDELWLLEHTPVFTQGLAGKAEHVLNPGEIPVIQTDRGGQVTYHGPGQLVVYPLLDLSRRKLTIRGLVTTLEQCVIDLLNIHGITGQTRQNAPGVYVESKILGVPAEGNSPYPMGVEGGESFAPPPSFRAIGSADAQDMNRKALPLYSAGMPAKICSIGLRVRRGCSYHGIALNVAMDLTPFSSINPCGFEGLNMAQMSSFVPNLTCEKIHHPLIAAFLRHFGYTEEEMIWRKATV